jgi:hypothetical protein
MVLQPWPPLRNILQIQKEPDFQEGNAHSSPKARESNYILQDVFFKKPKH